MFPWEVFPRSRHQCFLWRYFFKKQLWLKLLTRSVVSLWRASTCFSTFCCLSPTTSCAHNIQSCHWWISGNVAQFENKTWWVFSAADSQQSVTSMKPFALTVQIKCSWWKIEADVFPPTLQPKIPKESLNCVCAVFCRDSRVEELGQYYERKYAKPSTGEQWVSLFLGLVKKTHYSIWIFVTWQNRLYGLSSHKASKNSCYTTVKCLSLFFHSRLRPKFICYSQM